MTITTLSSREFNQDAGRAKKAANDGPVFITDRGRPAHVLLSVEEYRKLTGGGEDRRFTGFARRRGYRVRSSADARSPTPG